MNRLRRFLDKQFGRRARESGFDRRFQRLALLEGDWKLIRSLVSQKPTNYLYELYNLKRDPGETRDMSRGAAKLFERLKGELEEYVNSLDEQGAPAVEEQLKESRQDLRALRSLGYTQ